MATRIVQRSTGIKAMERIGKGDFSERMAAFRAKFGPIAAAAQPPLEAPKVVCEKCKGRGFVRYDVPFGHPHFGKDIPCRCKQQERKEERKQRLRDWSQIDLNEDFAVSTFEEFNADIDGIGEGLAAAKAFAENPARFFMMVGPYGCGKTHLAYAILHRFMENSDGSYFFSTTPDLLDLLRAALAKDADESYAARFSKIVSCNLLILDDFGVEASSQWAYEELFQILNKRLATGQPTILTTNCHGLVPPGKRATWEKPKNEASIEHRLRSRLMDPRKVKTVVFDKAGDYRLAQRDWM